MQQGLLHIDAEVVPAGNGIELRLLYDDRVIYGRRWDTLELAEADGRARLADLERAGWAAHW